VAEWKVSPHGAIEKHEDNLWSVPSHLPGRPLPRRMTIARLADGRLVFHDSFAVDDKTLDEIKSWGTPAIQWVTSGGHRLEVAAFKDKLGTKTLCPAESLKKVSEKVGVDGHLADFPADPNVTLETLDGVGKTGEAVMIVKSPDGKRFNLVFADAVMNFQKIGGFPGFVFKLLGFGWGPKVVPIWKRISLTDKEKYRAHLKRLAGSPNLTRIVPCHGPVIDQGPADVLRGVADRM
jgi:hypothetical protein